MQVREIAILNGTMCPRFKCFASLFIYKFPSYPHPILGEQIPPTSLTELVCMSHDSVLLDTVYWIRCGHPTGARLT